MRPQIRQLVIASSNAGKIAEITDILGRFDIAMLTQAQLNIPDVEETGTTFIDNALIKARHAARLSGLPALADDSGLAVSALGGKPGIYSARYAGSPCNDQNNNEKLLAALLGNSDRRAAFVCVMALCFSDTHPLPLIAEGIWQGEVASQPHGDGGFGYDPLFYVPSHGVTAAELGPGEKNQISHRSLALNALVQQMTLLSP